MLVGRRDYLRTTSTAVIVTRAYRSPLASSTVPTPTTFSAAAPSSVCIYLPRDQRWAYRFPSSSASVDGVRERPSHETHASDGGDGRHRFRRARPHTGAPRGGPAAGRHA